MRCMRRTTGFARSQSKQKKKIDHPGGVRRDLLNKDCITSDRYYIGRTDWEVCGLKKISNQRYQKKDHTTLFYMMTICSMI